MQFYLDQRNQLQNLINMLVDITEMHQMRPQSQLTASQWTVKGGEGKFNFSDTFFRCHWAFDGSHFRFLSYEYIDINLFERN